MNIKDIKMLEVLKIILLLTIIIGVLNFKEINLNIDNNTIKNNTITVSGIAEKKVSPDTAKISFSINEYSKNQKEAADTVNKKTKSIVEAIKDLEVEEKNIKTKNYSIYPEYNWNNGKKTFRSYRVSQSVEIIIKDLENTPKVLAKITELKVDNLNGPNMYIDNMEDIKNSLRAEAIEDAKNKAKKLASELGISLEKIVSFSENNNNYERPIFYAKSFSAESSFDQSIEEPEINPGEEKITKTVNIIFQIKD